MLELAYLYIWNDVETESIIASGIKFYDFEPDLTDKGGVVLLKHDFSDPRYDSESDLKYINISELQNLLDADIYSWGDFYWADYATDDFPLLSQDEISELCYFSDNALPKKSSKIASLCNNYLVAAHDDGWYLRIFYSDWEFVSKLLNRVAPELTSEQHVSLHTGECGFWIQNGVVLIEEKTFDVDMIINRNLEKS